MASRYVAANGNWNSTATWRNGLIPTATDAVYFDGNYTVTLTANATCEQVNYGQGTINLGSYQLTTGTFAANSSASLIANGGTIRSVSSRWSGTNQLHLQSTGYFDVSSMTIVIDNDTALAYTRVVNLNGKNVGGLIVEYNATATNPIRLTGTQNLDNLSAVVNSGTNSILDLSYTVPLNLSSLSLQGKSLSERLKVESVSGTSNIYVSGTISSQYTDIVGNINSTNPGKYLDSTSTASGGADGWFSLPPTVTLNSPANNVSLTTTTPTLAFTATDPEGEDVSYQVQVGNSDFSTLHMDVTTTTYSSGTQQTRVVSPALTQGGIDYYWRVRAKDTSGSYGAWTTARKMTTETLPPTVTTGTSSSVSYTTATVSGNATATGGANITQRGVAWNTSTNPTTSHNKVTSGSGTGSFNANLTDLPDGTTIYARAYAINSVGTSYGSNINFTTTAITAPSVTSGATTSITITTATAEGNVTSANGATITERGIAYHTSTNPTTANWKQVVSGTTGSFSGNLAGLMPNTTYYWRAYATNSAGTTYGVNRSFTTEAPDEPAQYVSPYPKVIKPIQDRELYFKIEKLDSNEQVIGEKTLSIIRGNVEVGTGGAHRKCWFTLAEALDEDWQMRKWKLYYGYRNRPTDEIVYFPQGVYIPINPKEEEQGDGFLTEMQGVDKKKLFSDYQLDEPVEFASGTTVRTIVQTVAGWVGESRLILADDLGTTAASFTFEEGNTAEQLLNTLITSFSEEWFYNPDGYLVVRKRVPASQRAIKLAIDDEEAPIYISSKRSIDDDNYYNRVTLVGGKIDTPIYRATYENTDAIAKAGGRIVQRYFTRDAAVTQAQVDGLAQYYLSNGVLLPSTLRLNALVIPDLEVGDVISKDDIRYEVRSFNVPLDISEQVIEAGEIQ